MEKNYISTIVHCGCQVASKEGFLTKKGAIHKVNIHIIDSFLCFEIIDFQSVHE